MKTILGINEVYNKYNLGNEESSLMFSLLQFELENSIPKFILYFTNEELIHLFNAILDFVDSINPNIRGLAHKLLLDFKKLNLICLQSKNLEEEIKENINPEN